jgi:hypothetical protein
MISNRKGINSRYLTGNECAGDVLEKLAIAITDFGGEVDATFDNIREGRYYELLGHVFTDHLAQKILSEPYTVTWEETPKPQPKNGRLTVCAKTSLKTVYSGCSEEVAQAFQASPLPIGKAVYELIRFKSYLNDSQRRNFLSKRSFEMASVAELFFLYPYLRRRVSEDDSWIDVILPTSQNYNMEQIGLDAKNEKNGRAKIYHFKNEKHFHLRGIVLVRQIC